MPNEERFQGRRDVIAATLAALALLARRGGIWQQNGNVARNQNNAPERPEEREATSNNVAPRGKK